MIKCNLRQLMATNKIDDVADVMQMSGLSRNAVNRFYKEQNIEVSSLETAIKLCDAFKCKLSDLLEYTPDQE